MFLGKEEYLGRCPKSLCNKFSLNFKAPPIICSRRQFQNFAAFSKIKDKACYVMRIVCWQTILIKYHTFIFLLSAAFVIGALRVN